VKSRPFYFEISDIITQFCAAFDDIVIGRYNKNRSEQDRISVRYVYAPKERVMHDIVNENKTLTLPVVSVNMTGLKRDSVRQRNKIDGGYFSDLTEAASHSHIKAPVPVNIDISMAIMSRYDTDMDQIISNFIPFCDPYVIISWPVPIQFKLPNIQEIRTTVLWSGDISTTHELNRDSSKKDRVVSETNFTLKGWLFKDTADPVGEIHNIRQNFYDVNLITSADLDTGDISRRVLSGAPEITSIYYGQRQLFTRLPLAYGTTGNITLEGYGFNHVETVLLSSNNPDVYSSVKTVSGFTSQQAPVSGQEIIPTVLNDNILMFDLPSLSAASSFDVVFVTINDAGYTDSSYTLNTQSFSAGDTNIMMLDSGIGIVTYLDQVITDLSGNYISYDL
jgi:hypothetical protein